MSDERRGGKAENERQYIVIDQMLTMHSSHSTSLGRRAFWLNTLLIGSALFLSVFAFVGDDQMQTLGLEPAIARPWLGVSAIVVLVCSIVESRVDWRSISVRHAEAATRLSDLKAEYRKSFAQSQAADIHELARLTSLYDKTMASLVAIPEPRFNNLKAEHRFKRLLSERISALPKTPVWFLRLQLRTDGIREALRTRERKP